MLGPNALTNELLQTHLRYLFSAHPIGVHNADLENALRKQLSTERQLVNGPIVELDPSSKFGDRVRDLIKAGLLSDAFGRLPGGEYPLAERRLYTHQIAALKASNAGRSIVVASGTGSGKTEAWLYPVINGLLKFPGAGLRAIVLYPMNALADDQRRIRMRGLLSETSITYGEYTGNTPDDERDPDGEIDHNAPHNELQTRKKMRENPPNILITNPSMLEYLLLRPEDSRLFASAALEYLILDEAHTYRGAYGIELGHLIRRLKARLGVKAGSLRAFVLSATIDRNVEAIARFASNLTGEVFETDNIFFGEHEPTKDVSAVAYRPAECYAVFTPEAIADVLKDPQRLGNIPGIDKFGTERVLSAMAAQSGAQALWDLLYDDAHVIGLRDRLASGPRDIQTLAAEVFGPHDIDLDLTITRLVDAAATAREGKGSAALLPARYHVFFRGLDGVRVCFNSKHGQLGTGPYEIGAYYLENRDICDCGYPLWELLVCGDCAAWYLRDRKDGSFNFGVDDGSVEGTVHIIDADEEIDDGGPGDESATFCLVCRTPAGCDCAPSLRRQVKHVSAKTCVNCGGGNVMAVMTGTMAPTQVLAEALTTAQDPDPKHSGRGVGKKLLTFSDSRSSAAQFAAQLERAHRQHVQRAAIYQALRKAPDAVGIDDLSRRVANVLKDHGVFKPSANNVSRAKAMIFAEFTASYASRRRLESLGLGASRVLLDSEPPNILATTIGSVADAEALTQTLLQIMQYDSAVTKPELMSSLPGYAGARPDVHYGLVAGKHRWTSPNAALHHRRRNRLFNLAARLVGEEKADEVLTLVWKYAEADGVLAGAGDRYQIDCDRLEFFVPEHWFRCDNCRRITPWALSGGRGCATKNCHGRLVRVESVIQPDDHFTRNIINPIEYLRIEEHTAQLDKPVARRIGADFRSGNVNILSCSTTFELGVDIGTLQSVFLRNVPPTVANYRQRAGRAGRARQGAAFLVTYCGPSPHDRVFFQNPNDIITGRLAVPEFNLKNQLLTGRHVNSLLLSSLWKVIAGNIGATRTVEQFFLRPEVQSYINDWAASANPVLDKELKRYGSELGLNLDGSVLRKTFATSLSAEGQFAKARLEELNALIPTLGGAAMQNASNELLRIRERRLIDYLSARAFLPSYAFPIYVVELRTPNKSVSLQRDRRIAIGEYAPGNQVVANKKLFNCMGIVLKGPTASARTPYLDLWYCEHCQAAYKVNLNGCVCGSPDALKHAQYIIPDGFMADMTKSEDDVVARVRREHARISQHVVSIGEEGTYLTVGPVRARKFEGAEFLFINHGKPGEKFSICLECGVRVRGRAQSSHKTAYGRDCKGLLCRCFLAHELVGEALSIQFDDQLGLVAPDEAIFYQTLSYALIEGISKALSIERRDLGVNVRRVNHQGRLIWEIMVLDNVPGGAGYVAQIMTGDSLERSFREAAKIAACSNCPEESSCYACLRSIGNQSIHDRMQRGPAMRFLEAVSERITGSAAVFGLNVDAWLQAQPVDEVLLAVPAITDKIAYKILDIGSHCKISVLVQRPAEPAFTVWLDTWRTIWPTNVSVREWTGSDAAIGIKRDNAWQVISGITMLDLGQGLIEKGLLLDGGAALEFRSQLLENTRELKRGQALPAVTIPLNAGVRTSERELVGHMFESVVDHLTIEDPYLYELRHEQRLRAWLDLPRTRTRCIIVTSRPFDKTLHRQQDVMFARIRAAYEKKHDISVKYRPKSEMHDRSVIVDGELGSFKVSLPKGLDFISNEGIVEKDTSVTIVTINSI